MSEVLNRHQLPIQRSLVLGGIAPLYFAPYMVTSLLIDSVIGPRPIEDTLAFRHMRLRRNASAANVTSSTGTVSTTPTLK